MRHVEKGHQVLIARDGLTIARIVPESPPTGIRLGEDKGKVLMSKDFDAPLAEFEASVAES